MNLKNILWLKPLSLSVNGIVTTLILFVFILAFIDIPLFYIAPAELWRFTEVYIMELLLAMFAMVVAIITWFTIISPTAIRIKIFKVLIFIMIAARLVMYIRIFFPNVCIPSERNMLARFIHKYNQYNNDSKIKRELDIIHEAFQCCGPDKPVKINNDSYPITCCNELVNGTCLDPYIDGCVPTIHKEFYTRNLIQMILSGFILFEVVPYIYIQYGYKNEET